MGTEVIWEGGEGQEIGWCMLQDVGPESEHLIKVSLSKLK
jgi:hypothetical protein